MFCLILKELRTHAPFTFFGAASGVFIMVLFRKMPAGLSFQAFYVLHPVHVVMSALVTASMYRLHQCERMSGRCMKGRCNLWMLLLIGYLGSIGIATVSDSLIPYIGETLMGMPNRGVHLGFIEKWWLVNPLAVLGVGLACVRPSTKIPHAAHVLLSTWASLFHILMAMGRRADAALYAGVFVFLFAAVWIPCCVSDIVFPLLFVNKK